MPDIKGNNKQIFDYLSSQGATGIGENADQFQKYMEKDDNRRQIYDYLSSVNAQGIGNSYDEFTAFVYGGDQQAAPAQAPAAPQEQTAQAAPANPVPQDNTRWAVPEASQFVAKMDELGRSVMPGEPVSMPEKKPAAPAEPEGNPFPYRGSLEQEIEEARDRYAQATERNAPNVELINEYDRRLKELHKSLDPTSKKTKENEKWLREHKQAYESAKNSDDMKEYAQAKAAYDETARAMGSASERIAQRKNREEMASPAEVVATGKTALGNDNVGRKDTEYMYRKLADELYQSADKEYNWSSKNDEGYSGSPLERVWTAAEQFVSDAGNNIDSGSLTLGLSKGLAMEKSREVGEKYNGIIDKTLKDMKMSDGDIQSILSSIESNGSKIQALEDELNAATAEIDAMNATYEEMVRSGDPGAEAYGKSLQEKIDAYNRRVNDEYKPAFEKYDSDRKAYEQVMNAIDAAVESGLTGGEKALLDALEKFTEAKTLSEPVRSTASKAGAGAEQSAEFMLDFILTGGIAKAGTKAATKLATKRALKKFGAEALKDIAVKPGLGLRLATDAAVSGLRTAAVFPRTLQAYGENATEYSGKDYAGRIDFDRTQANALGNSLLTQFIEYWSEGFGEYFGEAEQALFKSVTKQAPREMIGKTLRNYRGSIGQYLDKGKFDGMFNEMLEEVVGSGLNALSGWLSGDRVGDAEAMKEFFSGENIATLALSFLPMSAISAATNVSAYHKMKQRYDEGVAMLNPFIESGAISRKELEQLSKDIPNLTPNEIKDRVVDIADRARQSNEGHLPRDFAKNLLGYLEGDFAMSLRNDQWEDSQEKMSVVNSYATMYANPEPRYAWDIQQEENEARAAAEEAGFTQDELDLDSYQLAQQAMEMRNLEPERADALLGYANAKAALEGLENGYREQGEQIARANEEEIRSNLDVNGNVVTAVVTEYGAPKVAYITSDDVTIAPDGTVTTPTGNGVVKYRTYENGEYGPESTIMSDKVSEAQAVPTDQYIQMENDAILNGRNELYEQAKRTVSPTGQSRAISQRIGMNVVIRGNGAYQPVRVERMTDDGMKVVISGDKDTLKGVATAAQVQTPGGKYLEIDVTRLWPLLDKEADDVTLTTFEPEARTEAGAEQEKPQQAPAQAPQVNPDELEDSERTIMFNGRPTQVTVNSVGGDGVWFTYMDETGTEREGDMPLEDFMNAIVADEAPAAVEEAAEAPAPAQEQAFPVDEKGNRVYDHPSVSPERAYRELMTGIEHGSKDEANRVKYIASKANAAIADVTAVENMIAGLQAQKALVDEWDINDNEEIDAFEKRKAAEKNQFDGKIAELEAGLPELQRKAAHWASVRDMAAGVSSVRRDAALVARAEAWTQRTGIKVNIFRTTDEVDNTSAKKALANGERVEGWYNRKTGEVGLYLPNLSNESEVDRTFIHEVVSHKGLEELLGKENYDALCDKVWDQLMSEDERQEFLAYNSHLNGDEQFLRRAAADEWIARYSETIGLERNRNLFDKFVDFVKEFLDRILGEDAKISKDDIATLLRSSLARYESERKSTAKAKPLSTESLSPEIQAELKEKGETMDGGVVMDDLQDKLKKETGYQTPNEHDEAASPVVGDIRMSKTTITPWAKTYMTYPGAKEHVVKVMENLTERMAANELVDGVVPRGTYKYGEKSSGSFAGPLRTNIEYVVTFDMDTSCPRSLQYLEYVKMIEAQIGRPLTQRESIQLIEMMRVYGQMIPCVYCYCENKRQALKQYYTDFMTSRHAVISAKTDEEALEHMYGHATNKAAKESKDPEVVLNKAAYKVFQQWRQEKEYNPTLRQLWAQYHNDRNVVLTVLDSMLDNGTVTTNMSDEQISDALCSYLGITDKNAQGAVGDIVSEWKWNRIEDRPHDDYTPVTEEDELVVDNRTLSLWREMTLYGKSASSAKNVLRYVPYTDELKTLSQEQRDYINGMGGLRMHSSNDFRIDYVLDYFQFMADMEVNHMMGHTYTKSPEFVRIFGNSGYKINMSIAAYEDSHGIRPNPDEGFDWTTAKELREKFPNAGVMLMATSDAQIQMALDSDWIDMFIPFHHSGLPKAVWYDMRHWDDYTSKQNEKFLNGEEMRAALAEDGVEVPKGAGAAEVEKLYNDHFHIRVETYKTGKDKGKRIRPHFLPGPTVVDGVEIPGHYNDYNRYIELCREWGVHPRFYGVKVRDNTPEGGGRVVDITEHPAYMKCIKETARTDTPQTAIQFNFDQPSEALDGMTPIDYAMRELEARAASESQMAGSPVRNIYESYKQDPYGIVPQFIEGIIKHGAEVKERTGQDLPLDYLTPDSRKWFMTERKALEEAYKDVDTIPYHPHEYDADGNLIMEPEVQEAGEEVADDGSWTRFRKVTSPGVIKRLEDGPKVKVYRSMQFVPDPNGDVEYDLGDGNGMQKGFLYAPMSAKVDGKWRDPIQLGRWEEAEENPDMADENGEFILDKGDGSGPMKVAYAPYLHTRRSPLNEQFSSAYKRGNLVIVESEIPESELSSNYTAEKSKKSTGEHDWPSGKVSNALAKKGMDTRKVILSRWAKPVRLVPNSEVADEIVRLLGKSKLAFPYNVVTPGLRAELKSRGVRFEGWQGNKPNNVDELIAEMERADEGDVRFRKAPNGKESNLTDEQWEMVRTPEFKAWFGDWENDPANASKIVDENGEPRVVYHGTKWNPMAEAPGKAVFDVDMVGQNFDTVDIDWNFFFTASEASAKGYGNAIPVFLNVRNPEVHTITEETDGIEYDEETGHDTVINAHDVGSENDTVTKVKNPDGVVYTIRLVHNEEALRRFNEAVKAWEAEHKDELDAEQEAIRKETEEVWEQLDAERKRLYEEGRLDEFFGSTYEEMKSRNEALLGDIVGSIVALNKKLDATKLRELEARLGELDNRELKIFQRIGFEDRPEYEDFSEFNTEEPYRQTDIIALDNPNQIKSATNNNGQFSPENPDIRFRVTPEQDAEYMDAVNSGDMEKAGQMVRDAFKAAFPNTKVVDENGEPKVMYHGTHYGVFNEFETGNEKYPVGAYFTENKAGATQYMKDRAEDAKYNDPDYDESISRVYEVFLNIERPLMFNTKGPMDESARGIYTHDIRELNDWDGAVRDLIAAGYDGAINNTDDEMTVAFFPNQIKLADPVTYDDNGNAIPLSERFNPENNDIRFRISDNVDAPSVSANLYDAYENQNGEDKPWMSEQELIDRIEEELPYGIDTKELFSKIDEYRRLDEEDFDEGRRDFSGSERDAVFQEILSGLNGLAENGRAETSKEDLEKAERIAAAERIVTEKVLDSMPEAIGAGVQRVSRNDMPAGHRTDKGYYNPATNTVSVCMDNVLDERDAVATVIHETVGRKGLREIFGDQYRESMASSYAALDAEGRAWVNGYMLRNGLQPGDEGVLRGMQEYMAVQAERGEGSFLDAVNDILSQAVDLSVGTEGFRFTNRELAYILRASYEHAKNPGWLDTPAGKAQDTLWKREYGINESDPNRPTDPEGPDAGTRFRRGDTGNALRDYERDMKDWRTAAVMENQNADLPVKIGYEKALKEKYGDQWSDRMKNLPENEDYLMRHNLSSSRAETESHNFMLFHFNPMLEKLREVQAKLVGRLSSADERQEAYERILDYLYAVSGLERNEWERNNGGEAKDWSGLTSLTGHPKEEWQEAEADARAMVDAFKAEVGDDALLDQLWDAVRSCTDYSLDHAYRYGLLAKDEYERLRGTEEKPRLWNFYLPLRGFVERTAEEEYNYAGLVSTDKGNNEVVKDAKGRWTEADNPLANILNIALKEIVQGNENYARQALYRFATNLGENSLLSVRKPWYVKDSATGKWSLAEPEEGQDIEAFEAEMKAKKERKEARQGRKGLDLGLIMASKGHRNQHLIHVKVGGEDRMIWVNGNPALARAVSGIGKEPNYRLFRAGSRVISNLFTTYSIDFTAKNLLRDSIYSRVALLVKEDQHYRWTFMKNWWQNFGFGAFAFPMVRLAAMWDSGALQRKPADKRTKREQMFIDFMTDGGQTGYTVIKSVEKIKSDIERTMRRAGKKTGPVVVPILGWYGLGVRTLNEAFELLTRFTAYQTSRDEGRTGQRAAYDAKEISVNFNRKGAQSNEGFWGQVAAYFGGTHYFYNAGIQGFDNFLRLFTKPRKGKGWIMPVTSAGIMTLGFFTPMINALLSGGGDDDDDNREAEWYWNLPEWVRRNNIVIGFKNKYLAVPLPVEFRALYGLGDLTASVFAANKYAHPTPGRVMLDAVALASSVLPVNPIDGVNGSIASASELAESAVRTAVPDLTMFFVDWVTNKDYTGRALVNKSPYNPAQPASQGAFASTPKALVEACQWIGEKTGVDVAPGLVRDFLNNYGGGYYRFAEDLSKQIFTDDTHPRRWDDVPFLSGFTGHIDEDRTITYSNTVLNTYKDLSTNVVKKMNLYSNSADITEKIAFETPDALPAKARVQAILSGKDYELAKMYYFGMKDEDTGQTEKVVKVHQKGKSAGKQYKATVHIKIPGVSTLKKRWRDAKDAWASMPDGTAEEKAAKAQAYADMTNAWHEYYNAAADLADKLMDYDYGKTE